MRIFALVLSFAVMTTVAYGQAQAPTEPTKTHEQLQQELKQSQNELVRALGELHKAQVEMLSLRKENARLLEITLTMDRQRLTPIMVQYNGGDPKVDTWDWDNNRLVKGDAKKPQ